MKKLTSILALAAVAVAGSASAQTIRATVDGERVNFPEAQPMMQHYHVMVPVRGVFERMGADVTWNQDSQSISARRGNDRVRMTINSRRATINDREVEMETAPMIYNGSTLVPLRFISEAFGASVFWVEATRTVEIETSPTQTRTPPPVQDRNEMMQIDMGTVFPVRLNESLSSNMSQVGDRFTARLDTSNRMDYQGMPRGAVFSGHVSHAKAKTRSAPGVLGLAFDSVTLADGQKFRVEGTLIGLDAKSVNEDNHRLTARDDAPKDDLKYVGYGAGAGALLSVVTKSNLITDSLIGGALGYLLGQGENQPDSQKFKNVMLNAGQSCGIRLTRDFSFRRRVRDSGAK